MLSRAKIDEKLTNLAKFHFKYLPLSLKLAIIYSIMLSLILFVTLGGTFIGIHYVLYHEAEVSITLSAKFAVKRANEQNIHAYIKDIEQTPLLPGVVMRITDENNNIIYDNFPQYLSINKVHEHLLKQKQNPEWGDYIRNALLPPDLQFLNFKHFWIFYTQRTIEQGSHIYTLHFLRTITAEKVFLAELAHTIFYAGFIGVLISIICGFLLSKRLLRPLRNITSTAKSIEVKDLNQRIKVQPTHDEIEELANTFNLMLERLQKGFEIQRQFVSDASHELRTPATVICGYSDMLSRWGKDDPKVADECITAIHSEAINMQRLIEKLLFLARADQKRQVLHKEVIDLKPLIADITKDTQLIAPQHTVKCLQNDSGFIYADELVIRQMIRIFLENSIKYTPDGGTITLSSKNDGNNMIVKLADNGIGIDKAKQSKIFERFYRVDTARTKNGAGGTGLGLSIAKLIAEYHDIKIHLDSELNKGTTITLTIPSTH